MNKKKYDLIFKDYFNEQKKVKALYFKEVYNLYLDILNTYKNGGTVICFGNGGSASQSEHLATELIVKYHKKRKPIAAISLASSGSTITAHSNDFEYDTVFERQVEAFSKNRKNLFIGFSTSGSSKNILKSLQYLNKKNIRNYLITSKKFKNQKFFKKSKIISIESNKTSFIQEHHLMIIHILCEFIDFKF